jgi:hypothetical protein
MARCDESLSPSDHFRVGPVALGCDGSPGVQHREHDQRGTRVLQRAGWLCAVCRYIGEAPSALRCRTAEGLDRAESKRVRDVGEVSDDACVGDDPPLGKTRGRRQAPSLGWMSALRVARAAAPATGASVPLASSQQRTGCLPRQHADQLEAGSIDLPERPGDMSVELHDVPRGERDSSYGTSRPQALPIGLSRGHMRAAAARDDITTMFGLGSFDDSAIGYTVQSASPGWHRGRTNSAI